LCDILINMNVESIAGTGLKLLFTFILIIIFLPECARSAPDTVITDTQPDEDNSNIAWIVEPVLEYDNVYNCYSCGYTANSFAFILDKSTGQIEKHHEKHGRGISYSELLYDSEKRIFGNHIFQSGGDSLEPKDRIQTVINFPTRTFSNTLRHVRQADHNHFVRYMYDWREASYNLGVTYVNSKYAIAYGNTLLTEFIYDTPDITIKWQYKDATPVSRNGKWGFLDTSGKIIVPLIFDHAVFNDDYSAFVKIGGKYGIIDVFGSVNH